MNTANADILQAYYLSQVYYMFYNVLLFWLYSTKLYVKDQTVWRI